MSTDQLDQPRAASSSLRSTSAWMRLLMVLLLGLTVDLGSKSWAFASVTEQPIELDRQQLLEETSYDPTRHVRAHPVLGGTMGVRPVINRGAVFGIAPNQRWFFIAFTIAALICGVIVFVYRTTPATTIGHVALGMVIGGALGNLYDRHQFGVVRDFIQIMPGRRLPEGWTWPGSNNPELMPWVFNIADLLLLFGMVLLMVHMSRFNRRAKARPDVAPESNAASN